MPKFRCPNCGLHSNKFVNKCPKCGFTRGIGKEISDDGRNFKNSRERRRQRSIDGNKFRGGRNESFVGTGRERYTPRGNR